MTKTRLLKTLRHRHARSPELLQDQVDAPPPCPQFPELAPASLVITNAGGVVALKLAC